MIKPRRFSKAPTHRNGQCREAVRLTTILRTVILREPDRQDCLYYDGECTMRAAKAKAQQVCIQGCPRYVVATKRNGA